MQFALKLNEFDWKSHKNKIIPFEILSIVSFLVKLNKIMETHCSSESIEVNLTLSKLISINPNESKKLLSNANSDFSK